MHRFAVIRRPGTTADGVDFAIGSDENHVIARRRQWHRLDPAVGLWIVNFMGCNDLAFAVAATDHVNFSADCRRANRTARRLHRRQHAPRIGCDVVLECARTGVFMDGGGKAAEGVDLAAGDGNAEMIARLGKRRALAPRIGRWIVFVVIWPRGSGDRPAKCMKLAGKSATAATSVRRAGSGAFIVQVPDRFDRGKARQQRDCHRAGHDAALQCEGDCRLAAPIHPVFSRLSCVASS